MGHVGPGLLVREERFRVEQRQRREKTPVEIKTSSAEDLYRDTV